MTASGPHAINPALYENIGYDPDKDFEPIAATAVIPDDDLRPIPRSASTRSRTLCSSRSEA
jgi:hypothetical protein